MRPVDRGGFPFPLSDGPDESPFLTWIRNHSNYMAVRGLLDYFRFAAPLKAASAAVVVAKLLSKLGGLWKELAVAAA